MKEYIERELLLIGVDGCISALHVQAKGDLVQEGAIKLVEATRDYIASLSAADVAEVRHGRWIGLEYDGYADGSPVYDLWECSECGEEVKGEDVPDTHPWCYACGARMDGKDNKHGT